MRTTLKATIAMVVAYMLGVTAHQAVAGTWKMFVISMILGTAFAVSSHIFFTKDEEE